MATGDSITGEGAQRAESAMPAPPDLVRSRFGDRAAQLTAYARWLAGAGVARGLIGPREVPRIWERHVLNSLAIGELLPIGSRLVDVGSGAGLPGLALACTRPDLAVDLVEPLLRRTTFLNEVVADLGLAGRVRVVRGRAEEASVRAVVGGSSYVTARAVASIDNLAAWAFPLLRQGGSLLAIKGARAADEVAAHRAALSRLNPASVDIRLCGVDWLDEPVRVIEVRRR